MNWTANPKLFFDLEYGKVSDDDMARMLIWARSQ